MRKLISILVIFTALFPFQVMADAVPGSIDKQVPVLLINDVYRLDNLPGVRTLRQRLEAQYGDVLMLHAGDFLFPSLLSRKFRGKQMIDLLNQLDGDPDADDPLMFITIGNHEFEKHRLKFAAMLKSRMDESQFDWVSSNITYKKDQAGKPMVHSRHLVASKLIEVNGVMIGIFGLTIDSQHPAYVESFSDPVMTARHMSGQLRSQGAEIVIALTHLTLDQDKQILQQLGDKGPDIIFGGHEHNQQMVEVGRRLVIKADADALTAAVSLITPGKGGPPMVENRFEQIPGKLQHDPQMAAQVAAWEQRFEHEFCQQRELGAECLGDVVGYAGVDLIAEELMIRRFETNIGNWIADTALQHFREEGAQISFINAGSLRINHNLAKGEAITRRHLNELFAYPNHMVVIKIKGATLQQIISRAVRQWTGNGHWLQIAGFAFRHDPRSQTADQLTLLTADGPRTVDPEEEILAVTNYYLIDEKGDRDGYDMLHRDLITDKSAVRPKLRDMVIGALQVSGKGGIHPQVEGRICNTQQQGSCLAVDGIK
ncbi:MAG: 5'-nucleotidase C-terminal domain-containing protein [Pseudomonadota bacterium]|nr:5'-nucleotidase C-terminal domain-containing protein [Pseudomonadota bacterium]